MTEPTLSYWHTLYTTTRERFPDAPGLPEDYEFVVDDMAGDSALLHSPYLRLVPDDTALCIILDWAMRFGAWWVLSDPKCEITISPVDHVWSVDVYHRRDIEDRGRLLAGLLLSADFKSHHAAYFAAVKAIAGD